MDYYDKLLTECKKAGKVTIIGKTVCNRNIPLVSVGDGRAYTLIVGAVHAREHITVELIKKLFFTTKLPFDVIPCLNIDGGLLCKYGLDAVPEDRREYLKIINGSDDFSLWKANAAAVDINVNFDAGWGTGKQNVKYPSEANYIGPYPESEPETQAAVNVLLGKKYSQVICYHSKGEVIYWGFGKNFHHYAEAKAYADKVGYKLSHAKGSAGGLKDKFDLISDGLGLTVEVGDDKYSHPYPEERLPELINKHKESVRLLYDNGIKIARKIGVYG